MLSYYYDKANRQYVIERDSIVIFRTTDESLFYQVLDDLLN